jgi:integrase
MRGVRKSANFERETRRRKKSWAGRGEGGESIEFCNRDFANDQTFRPACGYALANRGHDTRALQAYLGHRNIQPTVRYTELSPTRFKDFWRN